MPLSRFGGFGRGLAKPIDECRRCPDEQPDVARHGQESIASIERGSGAFHIGGGGPEDPSVAERALLDLAHARSHRRGVGLTRHAEVDAEIGSPDEGDIELFEHLVRWFIDRPRFERPTTRARSLAWSM